MVFESWQSASMGGMQYGISFYADDTSLNRDGFLHLWKPEAFAGVIKLKTYLSKIDS